LIHESHKPFFQNIMLKSIKQLYGKKLGASDGEIGHVKDFYFDDQNWAVRYVVADTGSWLTGRQVLLSPHAFGGLHQAGSILSVNLTRHQIENSPSIESHVPVSRQHEEEHYQYYGWPTYWQGGGLWGMSDIPLFALPTIPPPREQVSASDSQSKRTDAHLRCTKAVDGYNIQASDGTTGHICDFMIDVETWAIRKLIVKTGPLFSGREVEIPTSAVNRISYEESTVFVNMTTQAVEQSPEHLLVSDSAAD